MGGVKILQGAARTAPENQGTTMKQHQCNSDCGYFHCPVMEGETMSVEIAERLRQECPNCKGKATTTCGSFTDNSPIEVRCSACRSKGWIWKYDQQEMAEQISEIEQQVHQLREQLNICTGLIKTERDPRELWTEWQTRVRAIAESCSVLTATAPKKQSKSDGFERKDGAISES